ncbi:iron-sulfur cluster assembly accessory protein [Vibrio sp. THAF190c]|uniref:iron-sulfur cluster assembly accessory protein n=1 Tax=Vibrio sp. THAF190c TaxID=2587865 RepID=UPI0012690153|nr:iron-sulfur cluster assembly accessory protein [Vibrio sp. THAF190c]QFT09542.1 Iron-binding protein IscA [Vibrio sp. THAF190c]
MSIPSSGSNEISIHDMQWQGVTLSENAANRITQLAGEKQYFHLTVKSSGCTGFAYVVTLIEQPSEGDIKYESHNVVFYVALQAMPMVDGTEIDFVRQGLNSNFVYNNPKVKNLCGCGESFGV